MNTDAPGHWLSPARVDTLLLTMPHAADPVKHRLWLQAASFAARAHRHQLRKDKKTPYIAHTFRVAMIVRDIFGCDDEVAICAAILHDTIEDTPTDYDDIHDRFGPKVADTVAVLTKNMLLIEEQREKDYDQRLAQGPWQGRLIKLADVFDNGLEIPKPSARARAVERIERALALTEGDTGNEDIARAREAVGELLATLSVD